MLSLTYGSRALSLGGAYSGVASDVYYMDSNPAGGDPRSIFKLSLIHQEWIADVNYEAIRVSYGVGDRLFFGLGFTYLYLPFVAYDFYGYSDGTTHTISQSMGMVNVGYKLRKVDLAFGANLKVFYNYVPDSLAEGQNYLLFAGDVGVISRTNLLKTFIGPEPSLTVGLTLKNVGYHEFIEKLPTELHCGMSYRVMRHLLLTGEVAVPLYEPIFGSFGVEFDIRKALYLQAGMQVAENPLFAVGMGYRLKDININASYTPSVAFRNMMSVSVEFTFGSTKLERLEQRIHGLLVVALEEYNEGDFGAAMGKIMEVLELDPRNMMAKQMRDTIRKEVEREKKREEL
jgi:hypothetical protein